MPNAAVGPYKKTGKVIHEIRRTVIGREPQNS
jgi:hypothetical protein